MAACGVVETGKYCYSYNLGAVARTFTRLMLATRQCSSKNDRLTTESDMHFLPELCRGNNSFRALIFSHSAHTPDDAEAVRAQRRKVADQLHSKLPKPASFLDEAKNCDAYLSRRLSCLYLSSGESR